MILKERLEDYTEAEFLMLIKELYQNLDGLDSNELERRRDSIVSSFRKLTEHPDGADVIYYPPEGADDSPQGVVNRVKEWRAANGKPGFKPA
ncbi:MULTISPECIES: bacteriocin immunity protein [Pseudomonas]|uniref:Bacteriocin immunity protein n=1 Tax=Pseudomonas sp. 13.2 TaxID=3144665 RepID=A0AAU7BMN5_9PSED|nr:bacteriocin immunity protein [Pseudomonas sp. SWI36]